MPDIARPGGRTHRPLPRRVSDEEARAKYRRDVLGLPGPIDVWITANIAHTGGAGSRCPLNADEVRCIVQMQCSEAEETDSNFSEPDTYALNLTIVSPPALCRLTRL
ncbi:hypothetical protein AcV7_009845 [Taiwanofungus camphoratus]|nr:hypothetical protein AcV7_009845 [Antrodia cinnamomea]